MWQMGDGRVADHGPQKSELGTIEVGIVGMGMGHGDGDGDGDGD